MDQLEVAREEERHRVAHELHETIGQDLVALQLTLGALAGAAETREATASLMSLAEVAKGSIAALRRVANDLRPQEALHLGLAAAIRAYGERLTAETGLAVSVVELPPSLALEHQMCVSIFRVAQQVLRKAARRGASSRVQIHLVEDFALMTLSDDGALIAEPEVQQATMWIEERARRLGGKAMIRSGEGRGVCVRLEIPIGSSSPQNHRH